MQRRILETVHDELVDDELFEGRVVEDFMAIAGATIAYLVRRIDHPKPWMRDDWDDAHPMVSVTEGFLADDYEEWLTANLSRGNLTTEVRRIAAGRADVLQGLEPGNWSWNSSASLRTPHEIISKSTTPTRPLATAPPTIPSASS